ncbi:uncharacterized protein LOC133825533 [Humulus lupulus]|uniref:uncharacterized protein LOC133825533 n=1 Tax=Humulus lupulus TaxID=3486 RepID=UPI002B400DFA|nr:uncharacterized protein LOC133825533 [Humulus lupulus]
MPRMTNQVITFFKDDARRVPFPHHDPLVVESHISNMMVAWILVDDGSSVNILFKSSYEKIGQTTSDLSPCTLNLSEFSEEGLISMGQIKLLVTLGEVPRQAFKYCTFVVVDWSSTYNAILGRPTLVEFGAITSIRHMCMMFPIEAEIGRVHGDQKEARQCYNVSLKELVMVIEAAAPKQPPHEEVEV